jgi:integrase
MAFACVVAPTKEQAMIKVKVKSSKSKKYDWLIDIRVKEPDGTWLARRRLGFLGTRKQAEKEGQIIGAEMLQDAVRVAQEPPEKKAAREMPTLKEFEKRFTKEHLQANRLKPTTIDTYEYRLRLHILPRLGHLKLDQIDLSVVQTLKAELSNQSSSALNHTLGVLSKVLVFAHDVRVLANLPWRLKTVKVKTTTPEMEFYGFQEYESLVAAATTTGKHDLAIVLLGGEAGLRRGEIAGLEWSDVDLPRAVLTVLRNLYKEQVTLPKGGRSRKIPMTKRLVEALQAIKPEGKAVGRVLGKPDGERHSETSINETMPRVTKAAGMTVSRKIHILRHTFCSRLAMHGAQAIQIMALAGHTDLKTTQRYMHLSPAMKDSAIRLLERPIPEGANA